MTPASLKGLQGARRLVLGAPKMVAQRGSKRIKKEPLYGTILQLTKYLAESSLDVPWGNQTWQWNISVQLNFPVKIETSIYTMVGIDFLDSYLYRYPLCPYSMKKKQISGSPMYQEAPHLPCLMWKPPAPQGRIVGDGRLFGEVKR